MLAGPLDRRATLQRPVLSRGAAGEALTAWQTVATVWASKRDVRGREFLAAGMTQAEMETTIVIRYRDDVAPTWRVVLDGRTYDIQGSAELGRRDGLELRCITATNP